MENEDESPEKDEPIEVVIRGKKYVQKPDEPLRKKGIDLTSVAVLILALFIGGLVFARLMGWY